MNLAWAVRISGDGGQEGRHLAKKKKKRREKKGNTRPVEPVKQKSEARQRCFWSGPFDEKFGGQNLGTDSNNRFNLFIEFQIRIAYLLRGCPSVVCEV